MLTLIVLLAGVPFMPYSIRCKVDLETVPAIVGNQRRDMGLYWQSIPRKEIWNSNRRTYC